MRSVPDPKGVPLRRLSAFLQQVRKFDQSADFYAAVALNQPLSQPLSLYYAKRQHRYNEQLETAVPTAISARRHVLPPCERR